MIKGKPTKTKNDRMVYRRKDGKWVDKKNSNKKPSSVNNTQKEAYESSKKAIKKDGGGEIIIKGRDGKIRDKNTIPPGNDPCPPKDKR